MLPLEHSAAILLITLSDNLLKTNFLSSRVAVLHRFYCTPKKDATSISPAFPFMMAWMGYISVSNFWPYFILIGLGFFGLKFNNFLPKYNEDQKKWWLLIKHIQKIND